jgi:glyoxylase-like metal-dependent hydrolase (beta-lactamase superfamily II)
VAGNSMRVGDVEIISVVDSTFPAPANIAFPSVTKERWQEAAPSVAESGTVPLTISSFVIRTSRSTMLVDTGIGPGGAPAFGIGPGRLLDALKEVELGPEDIDSVVITHLHIDHVGWNAREVDGKVVPTFPRARYYICRQEYDFFTQPEQLEQSPFLKTGAVALVEAGVVELCDSEAKLTDGVSLMPAPGHTPAHSTIAIASGNERGFIIGDAAHHPSQVAFPDIRAGFDVDGDMAQKTRETLWQQFADMGAKVAAGHFPAPGFGRIVVAEGKRMWQGA